MRTQPLVRPGERPTVKLSLKKVNSSPPFVYTSSSIASEDHPDENEDQALVDRQHGLAAVFDGVGGSISGALASRTAAKVFKREWKKALKGVQGGKTGILEKKHGLHLRVKLEQIFREAQHQIQLEGERVFEDIHDIQRCPSTTAALVIMTRNENAYTMTCAHVGDSRIYLLRQGKTLRRLTDDDSLLTRLVQEEILSPEDAWRVDQATDPEDLSYQEQRYFHRRNGIYQALGDSADQTLILHLCRVVLHPSDKILLCTDGIHDNLTDDEMEAILLKSAKTTGARQLVKKALARSQEDMSESIRAKIDDMSAVVITCQF